MEAKDWIPVVQLLASLLIPSIPTYFTLRWVVKKTQNESSKEEANAVRTFTESTDLVGKQNIQLRQDNISLQQENSSLRMDINTMKEAQQQTLEELKDVTRKVEKLEIAVGVLQKQIRDLGLVPAILEVE
jgi:hypothetical protein